MRVDKAWISSALYCVHCQFHGTMYTVYTERGSDLWKEPSIRSRALFLDVAIWQPRARPSASRIRAFLPGGGKAGKAQNTKNMWGWSTSTSCIHINSFSLWVSFDIIHPLEKRSSTCTSLRNINVLTGALYWNHLEVIFLRGPGQPSSPPGLLHPRNLPEGISNMIIRDSQICLTVCTIMATVNVWFILLLIIAAVIRVAVTAFCRFL